jgi:hypothetical protein
LANLEQKLGCLSSLRVVSSAPKEEQSQEGNKILRTHSVPFKSGKLSIYSFTVIFEVLL